MSVGVVGTRRGGSGACGAWCALADCDAAWEEAEAGGWA